MYFIKAWKRKIATRNRFGSSGRARPWRAGVFSRDENGRKAFPVRIGPDADSLVKAEQIIRSDKDFTKNTGINAAGPRIRSGRFLFFC
jgi:hypothetical protein